MLLKLKNFGKIHNETEIELNGITVLAGENGVGKSTVGKALFCVFDTFYNLDKQIERERIQSVRKLLTREMKTFQGINRLEMSGLPEMIVEQYYRIESDRNSVYEMLKNDAALSDESVDIDTLTDNLIDILEISNNVIEEALLLKRIEAEFGDKVGNVNYPEEPSHVGIRIQDNHILCDITDSKKLKIKKDIDILKNIVYIDDTYAMDVLGNNERTYSNVFSYSHFSNLIGKIIAKDNYSVIDDVIMDERLKDIIRRMDEAGVGDINWKKEKGWVYSSDGLKDDIGIRNISSGVKGFVLLRQLIKNGCIEDKGVIILDEPEIHLHPKWQKVYAEIIVRLQIEFNLTVLISTHSTDFLSFIEYYSTKNGIKKQCSYYMVKESIGDNTSSIENVTDSIDKIYAELSVPFLRVSEELDTFEDK